MKQKGAIGFLEKPADEISLNKAFGKLEIFLENKIKKFLIIEDDKSNQLAIQSIIPNKEVKFDIACTAQQAKESIQSATYDCIILDLNLPDMSGFELLKQLKKEKIEMPPIIVYTGRDLSEDEHAELQRYASSIVLKGANSPERLIDEISLFLHSVEEDLPKEYKKKIVMLHSAEELLKGRKILLVDDDMRNVFALSSVLEEQGVDVFIASNGQIALEKLQQEEGIELVIMDIMMPVMNGYEAMRHIRADMKLKNLPIIALTAKAMRGDREKCLEAGATDYITKPVDVDQLISMIKVWLFKS